MTRFSVVNLGVVASQEGQTDPTYGLTPRMTPRRDALPLLLEGYKSSGGPMLREYWMDALERIHPETPHNPWR